MSVLCIGEVLWDIIGEEKYLGGAPLNVAANLADMGHGAYVLSAVGSDGLGAAALEKMDAAGINRSLVAVLEGVPTGTAIVHPELDGNERFQLPYPVAYDGAAFPGDFGGIEPSALVYGTLAAYRSRTVRECLEKTFEKFPHALRLYDVNLRKEYFSRELVSVLAFRATVIKLNDGEVDILSYLIFGEKLDIPAFAEKALREFECEYILVTKGAEGAEMFWKSGRARVPGAKVKVVDTVGAGDAFSAGVLGALLAGKPPAIALEAGNARGTDCVTHSGAFPIK